jgi:NADPH-dependent glutamate synthase beta subunit-like oxidoreductase/Pyruvate/2-oxoacid:ferredoxin oxidoreductase delta subunit/ferredoxin
MAVIAIDGREVAALPGQSVLEAALAADIYIPHLCSHPNLTVQAGCGLCVVEAEGAIIRACEATAVDGMRVATKSEKLSHLRTVALELMLAGHPQDCTGCKAYLKCELQALMQYTGAVHSRLRAIHRKANGINAVNPVIVREMERCVQCGRCVRACRDLRGIDILRYNKLNAETYIGTENDLPLKDAGCRFCGACVEVCPTGALRDAEDIFRVDMPKELALVPCQAECPAHTDIPAYLRAAAEGRYSDAVGILREKLPFPHTLGHVCNNRCETGCKRGKLSEPISIRELKRFAVERDTERAWLKKYLSKRSRTGKKAAVIGGGACGLTAAFYLNKLGHEVTVFEKQSIPGGHMTGGMPEYRIPAKDVMAEIEIIQDSGVKIECGAEIKNAAELKKEFDAVLVAVGTSVGRKLPLPGAGLKRVYTAVELLRASRIGPMIELGQTVNVIGGGNVAFDAAGTLIRLGKAVNVICLEKNAAQATPEERDLVLEEGAVLYDSCSNEAIEGAGSDVSGLRVHRINGFSFNPETRELIEDAIPESAFVIPCDSIIFAAGQETGLTEDFGLALNRFGYPIDPETGKSGYITSVEGIFAAGDVITGTSFVIDAIAGARDVASLIDKYLGGDGLIDETLVERIREPELPELPNLDESADFVGAKRQEAGIRPAAERRCDCLPVTDSYMPERAAFEASRCLQCDLRKDIAKVRFWTEYAVK